VINLPNVSSDCELYCRSAGSRKLGGAVSGSSRKTMEWSRAWSGRSQSGNGAGSGGYRNRFERAAAFLPLMLGSHALVSHIHVEFPTQPN